MPGRGHTVGSPVSSVSWGRAGLQLVGARPGGAAREGNVGRGQRVHLLLALVGTDGSQCSKSNGGKKKVGHFSEKRMIPVPPISTDV